MATTTTTTNKPLNPRAQDLSPKGYNRASLYSGKALDFDGVNDQITFGTISDLTFGTGDFSAVLDWQIDSVSSYSWAIAKKPALDFGIGINNTGGVLRLWIGGTLSLGTENILGSDWKKIAVVRESGVVSAYINGQSVSLTETAMAGSIDSGDLVVGSWPSNADYWNGLLNNIRIFNTALTAAQVSDLYLNPEKIVPDGVANSALKLWLPMMEGAGTTAYDGSGNGNHGTINGATWTSGIGAPVAQTALVGWNKASNIVLNTDISDSYWSAGSQVTRTGDQESVSGLYNSATLIEDTTTNAPHWAGAAVTTSASTTYIQAAFLKKKDSGIYASLRTNGVGPNAFVVFDFDSATIVSVGSDITDYGVVSFANGWYRVWMKYTLAPSGIIIGVSNNSGAAIPSYAGTGIGFYADFPTLEAADEIGPALTTIGTAQTSPVLLPQGLTANKDITGVNSFENPRNAYALNLDGASWAEVHDNASVDLTTQITLECWYYHIDQNTTKGIFGKWVAASSNRSYTIYMNSSNNIAFTTSNDGVNTLGQAISTTAFVDNNWYHIVGTFDGSNVKIYVSGTLETTTAASGSLYNSNVSVSIGHINNNLIYDNAIALPRIYNRALTATEVARNYNADKSKFGL